MRRAFVLAVALATAFALVVPATAKNHKGGDAEISTALEEALAEVSGTLDVLISTAGGNYGSLVELIESAGGSVSQQFKYANGIAASIPKASLVDLAAHGDVARIGLDAKVSLPDLSSFTGGEPTRANLADLDTAIASGSGFRLDESYATASFDTADLTGGPDNYWGPTPYSMNAYPVWDEGNFGQDSLVAVIDTGVYSDHFMLGGRVVGGVDLSTDAGTSFEDPFSVDNHWHGTHVAGIAAGSGAIIVPNTDALVQSIEYHTGLALPAFDEDNKVVPLLGMAPRAELYAIKVFDHTGGSASESTIIAGIEHAIEMKETGAYDIDVINMSLGGWTGYDGRDLEDQVVDYATSAGITVVSSASNDGPYSMTINSPGTANSSVTVGAIAHPVNTRVFWDLNFFAAPALGLGDLLYVDENPQVIYFSSRGPTADGRDKPTTSAIGVFVLSAFTGDPFALGFASGTSMSAPGIAGVAALLNTYGETVGASPYDIKQAIVAGSHAIPGFDELDQGAGLIDAGDAYAALMADGNLGQDHPDLKKGYSAQTVKPKGKSIQSVASTAGHTFEVSLAPGMSEHYYFDLPPNAESVTIDVTNVDLGVDLGLNSFEFNVEGGVRDTFSPYVDSTNIWGDATIVIEDLSTTISGDYFGEFLFDLPLMPGYWKIVVENDWTSFDTVSGTFTVNVETGNNSTKADESHKGSLAEAEFDVIEVGHGDNGVMLELSWKNNFERYSTSDMDLIVIWLDTGGDAHLLLDGATISSPEQVVIDSTEIDQVFAIVDGYTTYDKTENYQLDVYYR